MKDVCECECGFVEIEFNTVEEMKDAIALHLMLEHGTTEWEEKGNPIARYNDIRRESGV